MISRLGIILAGTLLVFGASVPGAKAQNLITNGGFETGSFSGWTVTGNASYSQVASFNWGYDHANSGSDYAMLGSYGTLSYLSQSVVTVPGADYELTFNLASDGGMTNEFTADVSGNLLFDDKNLAASNYKTYQVNFVANSTATTIEFGSRDDPGYLLLDDVSLVDPPAGSLAITPVIVPASAVPLPQPLWMGVVAMGLMAAAGCRAKLGGSVLGF